jgi:hypothetical protein
MAQRESARQMRSNAPSRRLRPRFEHLKFAPSQAAVREQRGEQRLKISSAADYDTIKVLTPSIRGFELYRSFVGQKNGRDSCLKL